MTFRISHTPQQPVACQFLTARTRWWMHARTVHGHVTGTGSEISYFCNKSEFLGENVGFWVCKNVGQVH